MGDQTRRSFLVELGVTGLLATTGASASSSFEAPEPGGIVSRNTDVHGVEANVLGVEVIDLAKGNRQFFSSIEEVDRKKVAEGEYQIVVVSDEGDRLVARPDRMRIGRKEITTMVDDGIDLRVETATETTYDYLAPGDPVPVIVGAVQRENGVDRGPATNVSIEVTLEDSQNNALATQTVTTNSDGYARLEFDPANPNPGRYFVSVGSTETSSTASTNINYGVYTAMPFHWTGMTPGKSTNLGVYSELGGDPEQNVTRDLAIDSPDGTEQTVGVDIVEGGIGMLSFTPDESGRYRFDPVESNEYGGAIGCGELKALAPYFEIRDQYVGETVTWGAHVVKDKEPVPNRDIEVTVRNRETDTVVETITTTTNAFGQFTVDIDPPDTAGVEYHIDLEATDGTSVFLFGDRIEFRKPPQDQPDPAIDVQVDADEWTVAPGMETSVSVDVNEDGTPVANEDVSLLFTASWKDVPVGSANVTTGNDGTATHSLSIPGATPDAEWGTLTAVVERNGELYTGSTSLSVRQYKIDMQTWNLSRGQTNQIDVEVTDRATGDPVSDLDVTMFGNRYNVDTETFDADHTRTDSNGNGQIDLTIPDDVTKDIMTNPLTPYESANYSGGSITPPFSADISVSPSSPSPGETIEISYTTDTSSDVSGIAVFPERDGGDATVIEEGDTGQLTVPSALDPESYHEVSLFLLAKNGEATQASESVQLAQSLTASFSYQPSDPNVGETVNFDASGSTDPDGTIETYEWDLDGDGTVDTTGLTTAMTYDTAGTYDVTLTVYSSTGVTDSTSQSIEVSPQDGDLPPVVGDKPPTDQNGDGKYEDINGDGKFDILDVQALFANLDSDAVQTNPNAFDFNDDGEVNVLDVQALFAEYIS